MQPTTIAAWEIGLKDDTRPFQNPNDALTRFENAYTFRQRIVKRQGLRLLGRLTRIFTAYNFFLTGASPWTFSLKVVTGFVSAADNANPGKITTTYPHGLTTGDKVIITGIVGAVGYNNVTFTITVVDPLNFTVGVNAAGFGAYVSGGEWISNRSLAATEPNAEIKPGSVIITFGAITFTDTGLGTLTGSVGGNSGIINYATGSITLTHTAGSGVATVVTYSYFPSLPVMGINPREIAAINSTQTIFFDTKYAYVYNAGFQEFIPGTTWDGTDSDFFWSTNYRGVNPQDRLFFVTNNVNDDGSPMRYTNGGTWNNFAPIIADNPPSAAQSLLYEAAILLPYYGRLVALNCTEGTTAGGRAGAANIANRCRASAIGNPIATNAWRTDIFGQGVLIDAPTSESIIGATFIKNTLIVEFERSHWELRYVGEYGVPFIWERISSDFGSESQFSGVTFDDASLIVGSTAILAANANGVARIDENIPDTVFDMRNAEDGTKRVIGARDFEKELVYWCYVDSDFQSLTTQLYPQKVLIYNYRNGSFSQFRQNVTFLGQFQTAEDITWSSTNILWDDETVTWDDFKSQSLFPNVVCGNQQGFINYFNEQIPEEASETITAIDRSVSPVVITSPNHNFVTGDIVAFTGIIFADSSMSYPTDLNNRFFQVTFIDLNTFSISEWNFIDETYDTNFSYIPANGTGSYVGGATIILYPKMLIETKDFNPWINERKQVKLIRIDFLLDVNETANVSVMAAASSAAFDTAGVLGNFQVETYDPSTIPEYAEYLWHRFYLTMNGQFARVRLTYDDNLMNTADTHEQPFVLNAMTIWLRPGGTSVLR